MNMAISRKWQKLDWRDPFLLEQQLTEEQRMVKDSARQSMSRQDCC